MATTKTDFDTIADLIDIIETARFESTPSAANVICADGMKAEVLATNGWTNDEYYTELLSRVTF